MSTSDNNLDKVAEGRRAVTVMGLCKPVIDEMIAQNVLRMVQAYRGSQTTPLSHDFLLGQVAEITALRNLEAHLESAYIQGVNAAKKEFGDAKGP